MDVEYMCHSGSDLLVVDAARASFGKQSRLVDVDEEKLRTYDMLVQVGEGSKKAKKLESYRRWIEEAEADEWAKGNNDAMVLKYEDYNLIHYLAREKHLLPFRHPTLTLRCSAPLFVARQLGKHQVGMSWSEESRRYITTEPELYWPARWRKKADNVKQGSSNEAVTDLVDVGKISPEYEAVFGPRNPVAPQPYVEYWMYQMVRVYREMINSGVAPEQARMILPQNMMVTWVWTGTLLAWNHMVQERTAPTTQRETQEFARMVDRILHDLYPVSRQALTYTPTSAILDGSNQ